MEEDCDPFGSDLEGHDVVDVDDNASSLTDSELSVASSSHHHHIVTSPAETVTANKIDKKQTKKKATAKKKSPATNKKTSKPAAAAAKIKKKKTTMTTTGVDHAAEIAADSGSESSCGLEASVGQVADRLAQGCECRDGESCFSNINPESAYRHRLNIAELTRSEHDMYLMGVTMASLSNPEETARRTERKRLHTQYVFQVRQTKFHHQMGPRASTESLPRLCRPSTVSFSFCCNCLDVDNDRARKSAWKPSCTWRIARNTN